MSTKSPRPAPSTAAGAHGTGQHFASGRFAPDGSRDATIEPCSVAQYELTKGATTCRAAQRCTSALSGSAQNVPILNDDRGRSSFTRAARRSGSAIAWRTKAAAHFRMVAFVVSATRAHRRPSPPRSDPSTRIDAHPASAGP